jgi:hypothetical protein
MSMAVGMAIMHPTLVAFDGAKVRAAAVREC